MPLLLLSTFCAYPHAPWCAVGLHTEPSLEDKFGHGASKSSKQRAGGLELKPVYLDCNATTPILDEVREIMSRVAHDAPGDPTNLHHKDGRRARVYVEEAQIKIAKMLGAKSKDILFTSGASESNMLALMAAAEFAPPHRRHIISTSMEHHSIRHTLDTLRQRGFDVDLVDPGPDGRVNPSHILHRLRKETLLVSIMSAHHETGVIQPIEEIAKLLHPSILFHVDAAQTFGKVQHPLCQERIDLMSISAHKCHGPAGVGALLYRRKKRLNTRLFQENIWSHSTHGPMPTALIAGFGEAAALAWRESKRRSGQAAGFKARLMRELEPCNPIFIGALEHTLPHVLNLRFDGVDAQILLHELSTIALARTCNTKRREPSPVLLSMGLPAQKAREVLHMSWCHQTQELDWQAFREAIHACGAYKIVYTPAHERTHALGA